ncbi:MAG: CPXCG motif-containing cysteine-rich protein [Woeseiaceae bacterium]|nr:CPXCG motif-containing cysteine-rich protein [Woeseiaceae bacterium]
MDYRVVEQAAHCPFCGESISLLVDLSAGAQSYIEDCQVCCQPMQITTELDADEEIHLRVDCA